MYSVQIAFEASFGVKNPTDLPPRFVANFIFYGLVLNIKEITGSIFLNFVAMGCLQGLSKLVTCIIVEKAGRRMPYMVLVFVAGTMLLATLAFPKGSAQPNFKHLN